MNCLHMELVSEMASAAVCYMYDAMVLPRDTSSIVRLVQNSKSCSEMTKSKLPLQDCMKKHVCNRGRCRSY